MEEGERIEGGNGERREGSKGGGSKNGFVQGTFCAIIYSQNLNIFEQNPVLP